MTSTEKDRTPRPLGITHLVFGLIFGGIAAIWLIGEANDTDYPDLAAGVPVVLIAAGVIGLVAAVISTRRTLRALSTADATANATATAGDPGDPGTEHISEDTLVLGNQEDAR